MINKTIIQGRFTAKPEIKEVGGFNLTEFTVAWSNKIKEREVKCFLRCKAWRSTADFICKYFDKGQEVAVEGQLVTEEWEKDGQRQSRTILEVDKVHFCGSKNSNVTTSNDGFMSIPEDSNEELPFI